MTEQEAAQQLLLIAANELQFHSEEYKWVTPKEIVNLLRSVGLGEVYPSTALRELHQQNLLIKRH